MFEVMMLKRNLDSRRLVDLLMRSFVDSLREENYLCLRKLLITLTYGWER
jgi:hypothetical protein